MLSFYQNIDFELISDVKIYEKNVILLFAVT